MKNSHQSMEMFKKEIDRLRKKIASLEALAAHQKCVEEKLRESEEKYHSITNATIAAIITMDGDGYISFWNPAAERIFGYSKEEIIGKNLHFLLASKNYRRQYEKGIRAFKRSGRGPLIGKMIELVAIRKGGEKFPIGLSLSAYKVNGQWNSIGILRDITDRKQAEKALRTARDKLEARVRQRTAELQDSNRELARKASELAEANIALKILLQKSSEASEQIENKTIRNLDQLVMPYLNELAMRVANKNDETLINIIKANLEQITSSFTRKLSTQFRNLSPREIQVVNLIQQGLSTKEMASLLNISPYTVETYRAGIRTKCGIKNKKVNLTAFLQSFKNNQCI